MQLFQLKNITIIKVLPLNKMELYQQLGFTFFEQPIFSRDYYDDLSDNFKSPHLWQWNNKEGWRLRKKVFDHDFSYSHELSASEWQGNKSE